MDQAAHLRRQFFPPIVILAGRTQTQEVSGVEIEPRIFERDPRRFFLWDFLDSLRRLGIGIFQRLFPSDGRPPLLLSAQQAGLPLIQPSMHLGFGKLGAGFDEFAQDQLIQRARLASRLGHQVAHGPSNQGIHFMPAACRRV